MHRCVNIVILSLSILFGGGYADTAYGKYYAIKFSCEKLNEFLKSKEASEDNWAIHKYYPYVAATLNLYGRLEGRDPGDVEPFNYEADKGYYINYPLFLTKPEEIEGTNKIKQYKSDNCPTIKDWYSRSIFSDSDVLYLALLVNDELIEKDGRGKKLIDAIVGVTIKAVTAGMIDINQDFEEFISASSDEISVIGWEVADYYNPKNKIPKETLKTVSVHSGMGDSVVDNGTLFKVPFSVIDIDSLEFLQNSFPDKGSILANVESYLHMDVKIKLQNYFDTKMDKQLFSKKWDDFKDKDVESSLTDYCGALRQRFESDLSMLTTADRAIAFAEFVNQQKLTNPHLRKRCMGDSWFAATEGTEFHRLLSASLASSNENPFIEPVPTPPTPSPGKWLEKKNVEARLKWLIEALKQASSDGDGAVNDIANASARYAASPLGVRDTTGTLVDDIFEKKMGLDDLLYLVSKAARSGGRKIDVLGCYLNFRQLNDVEISENDWHWQMFGKWSGGKLQESDLFLLRIKYENSQDTAKISKVSLLSVSEPSLYAIANGHKKAGISVKNTVCGASKYPIGRVYEELY